MPRAYGAYLCSQHCCIQAYIQSILRGRQSEVVTQTTASIIRAEEPAPLQLRDDVVDEFFEGVRQERRRDDEPVAGFRLNNRLHVVGDLCSRPGNLWDEDPAAVDHADL